MAGENGSDQGESSAESNIPFKYRVLAKGTDVAKTLIRTAGVVGCIWLIKETIVPFAGEESYADIQILWKIATELRADQWIAYIVGGGGAYYGLRERQLRRKYIERTTGRVKHLEEKIDPDRSSSGLPETGESKPID